VIVASIDSLVEVVVGAVGAVSAVSAVVAVGAVGAVVAGVVAGFVVSSAHTRPLLAMLIKIHPQISLQHEK